jgi:cytochrome oxidase Cu insertion factor (SCO1/SenC/PrrC family)
MRKAWGKIFITALTCGVFLCLPGAESASGQTAFQAYNKPQAIPAFSLENLQGTRVEARDLLGRVTLLNFWATW